MAPALFTSAVTLCFAAISAARSRVDASSVRSPQRQRILNSIAVGRMGTPDDVARAALFFLSPDNGFVTGQVLYVCGGTTLGVAPV